MKKNMLKEHIEKLGLEVSDRQLDQFLTYETLLVEWNKNMNLTGITESEAIYDKHFADSLTCVLSHKIKDGDKLIDVGTGAGFPGMPLKIFMPSLDVTLLDSLNKRINFLKEVSVEADLNNITFIHGRAEDYGKNLDFREQYDIVVSRAVADLSILAEYCLPFVKIGGYFISQKSKKVNEEVESADKALEVLGGKVEKIIPIKVPNLDAERYLVVIKKIKETPEKYPRRSGMPQKKPIA